MFNGLRRHENIIVTGPNRSGTTIAATMIAADTGHRLVLEEGCNFCDAAIEPYFQKPSVIQAPFVASTCHQYDALIVFVFRDVADIEASQVRMTNADGSKVFWPKFEMVIRGKYHTGYDRSVAEITYENWQEQRERISHYVELKYTDLQAHRLWVDADKRKNFHVRQTHAVG